MRPLLGMVTFNRKEETLETLDSLDRTHALAHARAIIVDNGSTDGTREALEERRKVQSFHFVPLNDNIGCPAALNLMLCHRRPGQPFIKVDNDVVLETDGWVRMMDDYARDHPDVAMISAYYVELRTANQGRIVEETPDFLAMFPVVGHCVYHSGPLLDRTGFFDVLDVDHKYGFEDLLMAHRAAATGFRMGALRATMLVNIQRHNSLDIAHSMGTEEETREQHIARLRPRYEQRIHEIRAAAGSYRVPFWGTPEEIEECLTKTA